MQTLWRGNGRTAEADRRPTRAEPRWAPPLENITLTKGITDGETDCRGGWLREHALRIHGRRWRAVRVRGCLGRGGGFADLWTSSGGEWRAAPRVYAPRENGSRVHLANLTPCDAKTGEDLPSAEYIFNNEASKIVRTYNDRYGAWLEVEETGGVGLNEVNTFVDEDGLRKKRGGGWVGVSVGGSVASGPWSRVEPSDRGAR